MSINPDDFTLEQKLYVAESILEKWAEYGADDPIGGADFIDYVSIVLNTSVSEDQAAPKRTVHSAVLACEYGQDVYLARTKDALYEKVAKDLLGREDALLALEEAENDDEIVAALKENPSYGVSRYFSEAAPIDQGIETKVHRI